MDHAPQRPTLGDPANGVARHHQDGRPDRAGHAIRPRTHHRRRPRMAMAFSAATLLVAFSVGVASAFHQVSLPGGTPLTVDNTSPVNGDEFNVPGTTIDITDAGQATIGAGAPVTAVYTVDTSGSMNVNAGVDCTGDAVNDTRLECAQAGVSSANESAANSASPIQLTGLASFADGGSTHDVDLGTGGAQLLVAPALRRQRQLDAGPRGRGRRPERRRQHELRGGAQLSHLDPR